jgi:hypothetical protein
MDHTTEDSVGESSNEAAAKPPAGRHGKAAQKAGKVTQATATDSKATAESGDPNAAPSLHVLQTEEAKLKSRIQAASRTKPVTHGFHDKSQMRRSKGK